MDGILCTLRGQGALSHGRFLRLRRPKLLSDAVCHLHNLIHEHMGYDTKAVLPRDNTLVHVAGSEPKHPKAFRKLNGCFLYDGSSYWHDSILLTQEKWCSFLRASIVLSYSISQVPASSQSIEQHHSRTDMPRHISLTTLHAHLYSSNERIVSF